MFWGLCSHRQNCGQWRWIERDVLRPSLSARENWEMGVNCNRCEGPFFSTRDMWAGEVSWVSCVGAFLLNDRTVGRGGGLGPMC